MVEKVNVLLVEIWRCEHCHVKCNLCLRKNKYSDLADGVA